MSLASGELEEAQGSALQCQDAPAAAVAYTGAIDMGNTALDRIDAFSATYLEPLKAFDSVIKTIADVGSPNLPLDMMLMSIVGSPVCQDGLGSLVLGFPGMVTSMIFTVSDRLDL